MGRVSGLAVLIAAWGVGGYAHSMTSDNGCSASEGVGHSTGSVASRCENAKTSPFVESVSAQDQFLARFRDGLVRPEISPGVGRALQRLQDMPSFDRKNEKDIRGRTAAQDYQQYIARPIAKATKSIQLPVRFDRPIKMDDPRLQKQSKERFDALVQYWNAVPSMMQNRALWTAFLARNGMQVGTPHDQQVRAAERALRRELATTAPNPTWRTRAVALRDAYVSERKRIVLARGKDVTVRLLPRAGSCPRPVRWTSTSGVPILREVAQLASFYPISKQNVGLEGTVVLAIHIDASGCVSALAVEASSGSAALDHAAIRWEESASYQPATSSGRAVSFTWTQPVVFSLSRKEVAQ